MGKSLVADRVKGIIASRGLKQYVVAEKCGYSAKRFSDLLNDRKVITERDIVKICEGLDVTPNEIFFFDKGE